MRRITPIHLTRGIVHAVSLHSYRFAPAEPEECAERVDDIFRLLQDNDLELPDIKTPDILLERLAPNASKAMIGSLLYQHLRPGDSDRLLAFTLADKYPDGNILIRHTIADRNATDCHSKPENLLADSRKQFLLLAHRLDNVGLMAEEQRPGDETSARAMAQAGMINLSHPDLEDSKIKPLDHHLIAQPGVRGALWLDSLASQNKKSFAGNIYNLVQQAITREDALGNNFKNAAQEHPALKAMRHWIEEGQMKSRKHEDVYGYILNHIRYFSKSKNTRTAYADLLEHKPSGP